MAVRLKKLEEQVIVLTGATSGIGLTTARMAAKRGARLVLAARNEDALRQLTEEIRRAGGEAVYAVADVGNETDVRNIARTALEQFGGFDAWINDAGISIYGPLMDVSLEDNKRLFDTNFWGVVHGSLEAARHFRSRNDSYGGALINLGSEVSDQAMPLLGMYSASKHAVKGFTDSLRMELEKEGAPISVTLVKPGATDTPFPQHAKNYLEVEPRLPTPVYAPEVVAEVMLHCAENPVRDIFAAGSAKAHSVQGRTAPRLMDKLAEAFYFDKQKSNRPATHARESLHSSASNLRQRSGTRNDAKEISVYTKAAMHPLMASAIAVTAGLGFLALADMAKSGRQNSR